MQASRLIKALSQTICRNSSDAATVLFRRLRHDLPVAVPEVSSEAAAAAAHRSLPPVRLPGPMEQELTTILQESGVTPRAAKRLAQHLMERLQALTHTPSRGGKAVGPDPLAKKDHAASQQPSQVLHLQQAQQGGGGRLRGAALEAAWASFEGGRLMSMSEAEVNAVLRLPPPLREDQRRAPELRKLAPSYKHDSEALAYIVSRLAPEYAVCRRILDEVVRMVEAAAAEGGPRGGAEDDPARPPEAGPPAEVAPALQAQPGAAAAGPGVLEAVMKEAGVGWRPREVLVHGAGVGAAVVAALESLARHPPATLTAVEPSRRCQMLGERVVRSQRTGRVTTDPWVNGANDPRVARPPSNGPRISWLSELPRMTRASKARLGRRYDLVIAPYQLTLLPTVEERRKLVRELWDRCGDVLVLVEPGTPLGFAHVAEARQLVLGLEAKTASSGGGASPPAEEGTVVAAAAAAGGGGGGGAHVVAPCPHDATCPMQASGRSWCHFGQALERPPFMQEAMAPSGPGAKGGGGGGSGGQQEERFSYVVLRRGTRPALRVAVAPWGPPLRRSTFRTGTDPSDDAAYDGVNVGTTPAGRSNASRATMLRLRAGAALPSQLPSRVVLNQILLNRAKAQEAAWAGTAATAAAVTAATVTTAGAAARAATITEAAEVAAGSSAEAAAGGPQPIVTVRPAPAPPVTAAAYTDPPPTPARRPPLFHTTTPNDSAPSAAGVTALDAGQDVCLGLRARAAASWAPPAAATAAGQPARAAAAAAAAAVPGGPVIAAFAAKYPAYGPGLVGRLVAVQDAGVDWAAGRQTGDTNEEEGFMWDGALHPAAGAGAPGPVTATASATATAAEGAALQPGVHVDTDTDGATRQTGERARGRGGEGGAAASHPASLQRLGLSAAVAELALSLPVGAPAEGLGSASAAFELDAECGEAAAASHQEGGVASADMSYSFSSGTASGRTRQEPLRREDVSAEEYNDAERHLLARIYGVTYESYDDDDVEGGSFYMDEGKMARGDGNEEEEEEEEEEKVSADQASDLLLAEVSSYGWGRVVRPPRIRNGHTVLDLCMGPEHLYHFRDWERQEQQGQYEGEEDEDEDEGPGRDRPDDSDGGGHCHRAVLAGQLLEGMGAAESAESAKELRRPSGQEREGMGQEQAVSTSGRLVQQVVPRSARQTWMGAPAYRLARRLRWGDLWPDWYVRSNNTRPGKGQARVEAAEAAARQEVAARVAAAAAALAAARGQ